MSIKGILAALALAASALVQAPAFGHTTVYTGTFSAEAAATSSLGTGTATVTIDADLKSMTVSASFSGLSGNTTASHIHCCVAPPGSTGIAVPFGDFPLGVKAGTYDKTFDMSLASSYNATFIANNGGASALGTVFDNFVLGMNAGNAYFNIHTSASPGGEIRALLTLQPVPEPAEYGMMLAGLALIGAVTRKRKANT